MEQETYGKEVADFICQLTEWPQALDIREDGVYVNKDYLAHDPNEQAFTWTPACDMDWPGAPDPLSAPALPIPFTSRNLAAFMLDAAGYGLQVRLGRIEHGPDEGELESIGMRATKVRKALREAYKLAQAAQCVVGADNIEEQQRAADLLSAYDDACEDAMKREKLRERVIVGTGIDGAPEYGDFIPRYEYLLRLARVNEAVAAQKEEAQKAKAESDARHRQWLKAMVHQLLMPQRLRRAVQLDQIRVSAEIEKLERSSTKDFTEVAKKIERLAAGLAELAQIHKRLDALDSEAGIHGRHAAEISYVIEEMRTSRTDPEPFNADDATRRAKKIKDANEEIDALIAERTFPPVVASSDGPAMPAAPEWSPKRPKRFQGYGKPLYDLLKAAHAAGQLKPSARDVLDSWKVKPPHDVAEVTDSSLKYYDAKGNTKPADLEAIRKAIGRMTT